MQLSKISKRATGWVDQARQECRSLFSFLPSSYDASRIRCWGGSWRSAGSRRHSRACRGCIGSGGRPRQIKRRFRRTKTVNAPYQIPVHVIRVKHKKQLSKELGHQAHEDHRGSKRPPQWLLVRATPPDHLMPAIALTATKQKRAPPMPYNGDVYVYLRRTSCLPSLKSSADLDSSGQMRLTVPIRT